MPFDFNFYSALLLPSFINCIIYFFLFYKRASSEEKTSDFVMATIMLLFAMKVAYWMLGFAGWYDTHDAFTSFMFYFPFDGILLLSPLMYFYFLSVTNHNFVWKQKHLYHFILPGLWIFMYIFINILDFGFHYPFDLSEDSQYGTKGPNADLPRHVIIRILGYTSFMYYAFFTLKSLKKYRIYLSENFSNTEDLDLSWLSKIVYLIILGVFAFFLFVIYDLITIQFGYKTEWLAYFILGITSYFISFYAYQYSPKKISNLKFEEIIPQLEDKLIEENNNTFTFNHQQINKLNENFEDYDLWKSKIESEMKLNMHYLNPEVSLNDLARKLKTNTSLLSKVINNGFNQNFNDFINQYRIEAVKDKLINGEASNKTILSLAYECGFNSKATFNRSFKKLTGLTPKEFIERN